MPAATRDPSTPLALAIIASLAALGACIGKDPATVSAPAEVPNDDAPADSGAAASDLDRFTGTWSTTSATQTLAGCRSAGTRPGVGVTFTVTRGAASDLVLTNVLVPTCPFKATVSGDVATLDPGQTCALAQQGATDTYAYAPTSKIELATGDQQATIQFEATITSSAGGGSCTFTEVGIYEKQ